MKLEERKESLILSNFKIQEDKFHWFQSLKIILYSFWFCPLSPSGSTLGIISSSSYPFSSSFPPTPFPAPSLFPTTSSSSSSSSFFYFFLLCLWNFESPIPFLCFVFSLFLLVQTGSVGYNTFKGLVALQYFSYGFMPSDNRILQDIYR